MSNQPLIDPLRSLPGYQLRRISTSTMGDLARKLASLELRPSEASALVVIAHNPAVAQSDLGRILGIASGNLVPMIAKLEKRQLVVREQADGRSLNLRLSSAGEQLASQAFATMRTLEATLLQRIPEELQQGFIAGLAALLEGNDD